MNYDAGALLVPSNQALENWWNKEGMDLQMEYGYIDSIPHETIKKLIRVNMLPILTEAVPSKFDRVLNDAKNEMGLTMADIDSVYMGCNGVVYLTNRVFTPAEFASVAYPALAHPSTMNIIYWAIDKLNFLPFLLSMDSQYSLILPSNNAMLWYIDPATYGNERDGMEAPSLLAFEYDDVAKTVKATRYDCTVDENGVITKGDRAASSSVSESVIRDCLKRLMDQLIIVGDIDSGYEYYKSKGGTPIRVTKDSGGRLAFAGGWQMEHNNKVLSVNPDEIYTKQNGKSYQLNEQMPLTTQKSIYMTLQERDEFSEFLKLLDYDAADMLASTTGTSTKYSAGVKSQGNKNLRLLDNYNYTVYVPTNNSIKKLIDDGLLPTWEDYEAQTDSIWGSEEAAAEAQAKIKDIIVNFLRNHIQDHAIAINMAPENGQYQNAFETMRRNLETGRFYPLTVNNEGGQMWVQDLQGNKRNVVKTPGLYNRFCHEYWFKETGETYMASDVVVHQIDGVLLFEKMTPWKEQLKKVRRK